MKKVFDMGPGQHMTISGMTFTNGLYITEDEEQIVALQNYRKSLPYSMTEADYDEANPAHTRNNVPATSNNDHIIHGIHTSAHFAKRPSMVNDVLNAATDGSALQKLEANPDSPAASMIDIEALTIATKANEAAVAVNMASVLAASEKGKK